MYSFAWDNQLSLAAMGLLPSVVVHSWQTSDMLGSTHERRSKGQDAKIYFSLWTGSSLGQGVHLLFHHAVLELGVSLTYSALQDGLDDIVLVMT